MYATDRRQTASSLNAPAYYGRGHNNAPESVMIENNILKNKASKWFRVISKKVVVLRQVVPLRVGYKVDESAVSILCSRPISGVKVKCAKNVHISTGVFKDVDN